MLSIMSNDAIRHVIMGIDLMTKKHLNKAQGHLKHAFDAAVTAISMNLGIDLRLATDPNILISSVQGQDITTVQQFFLKKKYLHERSLVNAKIADQYGYPKTHNIGIPGNPDNDLLSIVEECLHTGDDIAMQLERRWNPESFAEGSALYNQLLADLEGEDHLPEPERPAEEYILLA